MPGSSKRGSKPQKVHRPKSYADGGAVVDDVYTGVDTSVDVDKAADAIRSQSWMQHLGRTRKANNAADPGMVIPTPQINDKMSTMSSGASVGTPTAPPIAQKAQSMRGAHRRDLPANRDRAVREMESGLQQQSGVEAAKGGMVRRVAGKPIGREDGIIAVQKGEFVIKKSSAAKYGPAKMSAVNRGTAKITTKGKR